MKTGMSKWIVPMVAVVLAAGACSSHPRSTGLTNRHQTPTSISSVRRPEPIRGVLAGQLVMEGGASGSTAPRPVSGTVNFIRHGHVVATAPAGADGKFSRALSPGLYQIQACTPRIQAVAPDRYPSTDCGATVQATVVASRTTIVATPYFIVP
jgi:hypothetical protein